MTTRQHTKHLKNLTPQVLGAMYGIIHCFVGMVKENPESFLDNQKLFAMEIGQWETLTSAIGVDKQDAVNLFFKAAEELMKCDTDVFYNHELIESRSLVYHAEYDKKRQLLFIALPIGIHLQKTLFDAEKVLKKIRREFECKQ